MFASDTSQAHVNWKESRKAVKDSRTYSSLLSADLDAAFHQFEQRKTVFLSGFKLWEQYIFRHGTSKAAIFF